MNVSWLADQLDSYMCFVVYISTYDMDTFQVQVEGNLYPEWTDINSMGVYLEVEEEFHQGDQPGQWQYWDDLK